MHTWRDLRLGVEHERGETDIRFVRKGEGAKGAADV